MRHLQTLSTKLGWKFPTEQEALWVKVLQSKYYQKKHFGIVQQNQVAHVFGEVCRQNKYFWHAGHHAGRCAPVQL